MPARAVYINIQSDMLAYWSVHERIRAIADMRPICREFAI
jgi:hypothetical protein